MNSNSASISNTACMAVMSFTLVGWMLPAQAGRQHDDWLQLAVWAGERYLAADNREYADSSSHDVRRYPPRQNSNGYGAPANADQRNNRGSRGENGYGKRNSSGSYSDGEAVTEKRQYYGGRRGPYSSEAQGNRRSSKAGQPATEQPQYYGGRRPVYSSESQRKDEYPDNRSGEGRRRNTSLDDAASWARNQSRGREISPSSESRRREKSSDNRTGKGGKRNTSLDDAVSWARRQSRGRVLSAETVQKDNQQEHRVRIITDEGRVRRYRMDAQTGNLLPRKR